MKFALVSAFSGLLLAASAVAQTIQIGAAPKDMSIIHPGKKLLVEVDRPTVDLQGLPCIQESFPPLFAVDEPWYQGQSICLNRFLSLPLESLLNPDSGGSHFLGQVDVKLSGSQETQL